MCMFFVYGLDILSDFDNVMLFEPANDSSSQKLVRQIVILNSASCRNHICSYLKTLTMVTAIYNSRLLQNYIIVVNTMWPKKPEYFNNSDHKNLFCFIFLHCFAYIFYASSLLGYSLRICRLKKTDLDQRSPRSLICLSCRILKIGFRISSIIFK